VLLLFIIYKIESFITEGDFKLQPPQFKENKQDKISCFCEEVGKSQQMITKFNKILTVVIPIMSIPFGGGY
jgi:hypothetical protein